jgi:hypothetical protein
LSNYYGSQSPPGFGSSYGGIDAGRDDLTRALMNVQNPPPGGLGQQGPQIPGMQLPGIQGEAQPWPQPGAMGGAPQQPTMGLPGITQPGQLPMGMQPTAAGGAPPLPMPPRY